MRQVLQNAYSRTEKFLYTNGICSTESLFLPDFLGIGLPQSGTTWLYNNLRCHPELHLPDIKELHYFDRQFHRSLQHYSCQFNSCHGGRKGEITPGYSRLISKRIQFIRKIMPDVRLIILVRNPIEQQWSTARRILSRVPEKRIDEVAESEFYSVFKGITKRTAAYIPGSKAKLVINLLDNWLSVYPREQLYIGYFDDIIKQPKKLLQEVFHHIGVSVDVNWDSFPYQHPVNSNPEYPLPEKYREFLQEMHRKDIKILCERFGAPPEWQNYFRKS